MCPESVKQHPIPASVECYWVLPGRLLAGQYPAHVERDDTATRLDALLAAGIDTFMDLTQEHELAPYASLLGQRAAHHGCQVQYHRLPIVDFGVPSRGDMLEILDRLDAAVEDKHNVYLHCWGGVGRTGLTVGCFLVRHGMTGPAALAQIEELRRPLPKRRYSPHSPETPEQVQFILNWQHSIKAPEP